MVEHLRAICILPPVNRKCPLVDISYWLQIRLGGLAFLLVLIFSTSVRAQYTTASDGSGGLIITGYTGGSGNALVIPGTISGLPVTAIGANAFSLAYYEASAGLTSVTIPASVKSIGNGAFAFDSALQTVTMSSGLISIGAGAFYGCTDLLSVTIPNSVTSIDANPFGDCTHLTAITVSAQNSAYVSVNGYPFRPCSDAAHSVPRRQARRLELCNSGHRIEHWALRFFLLQRSDQCDDPKQRH